MDVMHEVTQQRLMKERELLARCDRTRMLDLRFKFLEQAKHYFGVPYKKKYHEPGTVEYNSPLFLDCCGLVRRVLLDLKEDFGFTVGRWNQAYQFDTLPVVLNDEESMEPGDLVFISGIYNDTKRKKQKHNMVHVEIWAGDGKRTIGARWQKGKVQVHDSYRFEAKSYHSMTYHFRSIDTWLRGICKSYCKQHPWKRSNFKPSKRSVFARQEQVGSDEDDGSGDDAASQERSALKNQPKGSNVEHENVNHAGESDERQKQMDGSANDIARSPETDSCGSDVVQTFAAPPSSITRDEDDKEQQNISSGVKVHQKLKSIVPVDLPGLLTVKKACGGGEFTEDGAEIGELTSKGHWKVSDIISKKSNLQMNPLKKDVGEIQPMPQRGCHHWAEVVENSEKKEGVFPTGHVNVSDQCPSDRVNFDLRVKHLKSGFELDYSGDLEDTKGCIGTTHKTQRGMDIVIDDLVEVMSRDLGNREQNLGALSHHKPDVTKDVFGAPKDHLPLDPEVDTPDIVNIGCVSKFCRPDLKQCWTTREKKVQTNLPSQRHATEGLSVELDHHISGSDRAGVPQLGVLGATLGGDLENGRSDHCWSTKSDLVVCDLDDTESVPWHVPREIEIHRDETGEVEGGEDVTKMLTESTEGNVEMLHQLVEGGRGQMLIHDTLEEKEDEEQERDAEDNTSLDEGEEGLMAGSRETPETVSGYLPADLHHPSTDSLMPPWNNSTYLQVVKLGKKPCFHQSAQAWSKNHQSTIPTDADDPNSSPSQSSSGGSLVQRQSPTGSGGGATAASDGNEPGDNTKGDDDDRNEDKDEKKKPNSDLKKPVFKVENMPSFYVGGHNGVSLVEEPLLAKGWQRIQDPKSDRFKLRWVEIKSQINYSSFKPGEQLLNRIPGSGMLATKTGLFNTLRDYERLNERLKRGNSAKGLKTSDFFPESYVLDMKADREAFFQTFKEGEIWICKPNNMNQGKGIYLVRDIADIKAKYQNEGLSGALPRSKVKRGTNQRLIQRYLPNPLLLNGKKFDVRTYMLIACTSPFVVFYHSGYCRLSCEDYDPESKDLARHLTNQYQQKKVPQYKDMKDETVWSMERFNDYINTELAEQHGLPDDWVFGPFTKRMHQVMTHCFHAVKNKLDTSLGLFDLLGFDFIIDAEMKIWLLEVNVNPALHTNCDVLKEKLPPMIAETLDITLEIFEKSRKREKILPIRSMKNFHLLYSATTGGSRRANATGKRSKSTSPSRTVANPHSLGRNKGTKSTQPPKGVSVAKEKEQVKVHTPQATMTVEIKKTGTNDGVDSSEKKSK